MQITEIEKSIESLNGIIFEEMIQSLIVGRYYFEDDFKVYETGKIPGTQHPSASQVDIWFSFKKDNMLHYYFVAVTKQKNNVFGPDKKAESDIQDMMVEAKKTQFSHITLVFVCTQNPEPEQVSVLKGICEKEGCEFEFWGLNVITSMLEHNPTVLDNYLHLYNEPSSIIPLADYLTNKKDDAHLDKQFLYREKERKELINSICEDGNKVSIVRGPSGCGKTRLVIEIAKELQKERGYCCYSFKPNGFSSVEKALGILPKYKPTILIIDDANIYNYLNQHIERILNLDNIFVVMTLRDYLWNDFSKKINFQYYDLNLPLLKKAEIEEIVKTTYNVTNKRYLDYLYTISKNNLRFALMATQLFAKQQTKAKTVADVLENYYKGILKESGVEENEDLEKTIIAVSLLGRTDIRDIVNNSKICALFGIERNSFIQLCYTAQDKEFVSIFKNAIVEITDQVLAEYLIYTYVFLYKKIDLTSIFEFLYKNKQSRIVWFFNALLSIYGKNDHIELELNKLKNHCLAIESEDKKFTFFQLFGELFPNECISYAVDYIRNNDTHFVKEHYHLLARFINDESCYSQVAYWFGELLDDKKTRESTISYIDEHFKITVETLNEKYAFEIKLLETILEKARLDEGLSECLFKIIKGYFSYESNYSEYDRDTRQVYFKRFIVPYSEEYRQLRALLWDGISYLVEVGNYKKARELLSGNRFGDISEIKKVRQFDKEKAIELYYALDISKRDDLLLAFYLLNPYKATKQVKELFDKLRSNKFIDLYYVYVFEGTSKHLYGAELTKDFENNFLKQYNNYDRLVEDLIKFYNLFYGEDSWKIGALITIGFEYLHEKASAGYDALVMAFINGCGGVVCFNPYDLLKNISNKKTFLNILKESKYPNKELLISQLLLSIKLDEIDEDIYLFALDFNTHRRSIVYGNDNVMSFSVFESFKPGFIYTVIKAVSVDLTNSNFVEHLFTDDKRLQETIHYFNGDIALMKAVYFAVLKTSQFCDYQGVYIQYLTLVDDKALDEYLDVLFDGKNRVEIRPWLFGLNGFIESFIKHIDKTEFVGLSFFVGHTVNLMPDEIFSAFIESYIKKHKNDSYKLQTLSCIVFQREKSDTQIVLFKMLVKYSIPVETLKIMQLFDGPHSWSGSVVPYIYNTIKQMELLISNGEIKEPYISYLKARIEYQKKRAREEEISEFNRDDY